MKHYYILDADNRPVVVDVLTWAKWFEVTSNRIVDYTEITSAVHVSTVFIGLDHRFDDSGPPLLFETLIFGGPSDGNMERYSSWDDAVIGHRAMVRKTRALAGVKR